MLRRKLLVLKKVLVVSAIGLSITALGGSVQPTRGEEAEIHSYDCQYGRCYKIKENGERCKNCAQQGSLYCWSHRK